MYKDSNVIELINIKICIDLVLCHFTIEETIALWHCFLITQIPDYTSNFFFLNELFPGKVGDE